MRRSIGLVAGLLLACVAHAGSGTLRVGNQVLVVGDSAARVVELLGKPSYRTHARATARGRGRRSRHRDTGADGEQWQYRRGDRLVVIVVADGKVAAIRDDGR